MQNVKLRPTDVPKLLWFTIVSIVVVLLIIPFNMLKKLITRSKVKRDFEAEELVSNETSLKRRLLKTTAVLSIFSFQHWADLP